MAKMISMQQQLLRKKNNSRISVIERLLKMTKADEMTTQIVMNKTANVGKTSWTEAAKITDWYIKPNWNLQQKLLKWRNDCNSKVLKQPKY